MMLRLFLLDSKCATDLKEKYQMYKILNYRSLKSTLLYRGSDHGWNIIDFHSRCDNKGHTICLFKVKEGDCIGGFTTAQWLSDPWPGTFVRDNEAMLFNLSTCRFFPTNKQGSELFCSKNYGPYFGNFELSIREEPFNGDNMCRSYPNRSYFSIPVEGGKNMLSNKEVEYFTISELEVWQVNYNK